jgi:hypothetical protein
MRDNDLKNVCGTLVTVHDLKELGKILIFVFVLGFAIWGIASSFIQYESKRESTINHGNFDTYQTQLAPGLLEEGTFYAYMWDCSAVELDARYKVTCINKIEPTTVITVFTDVFIINHDPRTK